MDEQEKFFAPKPDEDSMVAEALRLGGKIVREEKEEEEFIREPMPDGSVQLIGKDGTRYDEETGEVILQGSGDDNDSEEE
jgi:hypothetical protein